MIIFAILTFIPPRVDGEELSPVSAECIHQAALHHNVPVAALYGILAVERGTVGERSKNKNGTEDYGVMQVNTCWLEELEEQGISAEQLENNGCLNVFTSAWILKKHLDTTGNIWLAIGRYHSGTKDYAKNYTLKIFQNLIQITDYEQIIQRANKNIGEQLL